MTKINRVDIDVEGDKRQYAPYEIIDNCSGCGIEIISKLYKDPHYLSYPIFGVETQFYGYCKECAEEWKVPIKVDIVVELIKGE